ncbi:ferrous iron transport protein B [Caldisalinibacter kiritimatiensis]|uniref:Ferrous iron transport protein B n=1 Tax=Caldisalinibacter kiritimatiensis TaxID=1304284 RepID=R1CN45_9FIRM|nr:ferrous iron transport protein B [Caldisalinibacter kiritimatiensis]EOD00131.1 Ferrous iron transport protein B [Caldisalinibacter kiritimatiensis]
MANTVAIKDTSKSHKIALVGNPNSGKTTLFNALTGSTQYVGNWPGVTVEKKEGKLRKSKTNINIIDLPGIYSLSPYTLEEVVARNYITDEKPDAIINIIDATNIERNLYLTTQLKEIGVPIIIALNMMDVIEKNGDKIDVNLLEQKLEMPIVPISANKGTGIEKLVKECEKVVSDGVSLQQSVSMFQKDLETSIKDIQDKVSHLAEEEGYNSRWLSIKLLEQDEKILEKISIDNDIEEYIDKIIEKLETKYDDDMESILADRRYEFIDKIVKVAVKKKNKGNLTTSDKIDKVVTNRILAIPIFLAIMWVVYYVSIQTLGDYTIGWVEEGIGLLADKISLLLTSFNAAEWLHALIIDGIIGGIGSVLVFVPQLMILFFFISLLEDSGYMARVAFVMDKFFRKFGLTGKSFIPMLIGSGCSVPGIMATRTLENDKDRKLTILLTPFISCGAKLPIYVMFASAFFPQNSGVVVFTIYVLGIVVAILSGILLKNTVFKGESAPFVMELPPYRVPTIKGLLIHMWDRGKAFLKKAGTIIFAASVIIWFLQSFSPSLSLIEDISNSILASIGRIISPIFKPLGFGDWISSVAIFTGLVAKEVVVATFGILSGVGEVAEDSAELISNIQVMFTPLKAWSFMAFNLLAAPCIAAIGAMKREFNSWKWTLFALGYQTSVAYLVALLIYQIGKLVV